MTTQGCNEGTSNTRYTNLKPKSSRRPPQIGSPAIDMVLELVCNELGRMDQKHNKKMESNFPGRKWRHYCHWKEMIHYHKAF